MKRTSMLTALLTVLLTMALALPTASLTGQEQNQEKESPSLPSQQKLDEVNFLAYSVKEAAEHLRHETGINITCSNQARQIHLPQLRFRNVTPAEIFETMQRLSVSTGELNLNIEPIYKKQKKTQDVSLAAIDSEPITWLITTRTKEQKGKDEIRVMPFNLYGLLAETEYTLKDVTTAIETALDLRDFEEKPELKFHKETKLLLCRGTPQQLEMIGHILDALEKTREHAAKYGGGFEGGGGGFQSPERDSKETYGSGTDSQRNDN